MLLSSCWRPHGECKVGFGSTSGIKVGRMTQPFSKNAAEQWGLNLDIDSWLRSLGLGQYEAAFRENNIDEMVLTNLTVEDLKELGVVPLGHRRKLLDAIAALRADVGVNAPSAAVEAARPSTAKPTETPIAQTVGERRHITVLFCDLFGSTGISAGLDAEDWRNLVGAYLNAASVAVMEMGGRVKMLGDGLMAVFGHPFAQENDVERSARAALSIQRALAEINRNNARSGKPAINARIGIETGPVVVDAAGEIYGDAPNTAARVQALAEPGTVLVTARVQRQIAGLFVVEERGTHKLKGVPKPVKLFRLVRASGGGRRSRQRHLTPLVGRDGDSDTRAALGARLARRRAVCAYRWRAGTGQVALDRGIPYLASRDTTYLGRMELFSAPAKHAAASHRRMGSHPLRRSRYVSRDTPRGTGNHARASQARTGRKRPPPGAAVGHPHTAGAHTYA